MADPLIRRFDEYRESKAAEWFENPVSTEDWYLSKEPVHEAAEEPRLAISRSGVTGYAKRCPPGRPEAANEKIASDLAMVLKIPVPPVVLWQDEQEEIYSISMQAFPCTINWGQATTLIADPQFQKNCRPIFAAAYVFHCWIDDGDHDGSPRNVIVNKTSSVSLPEVAFVDHTICLHWGAVLDQPIKHRTAGYGFGFENGCGQNPAAPEISAPVNWITELSPHDINAIVDKIPEHYLAANFRKNIAPGLLERQKLLAKFFGT